MCEETRWKRVLPGGACGRKRAGSAFYQGARAKTGDAVVVPKQEGAQGFYKAWVSGAPIEAE